MFKNEDKLVDNINDDISILLKELCRRTKWNKEQKDILSKTIELLKEKKYITFG